MALRYCDHGSYPAYAATPTWGVPQEGDGLAKGISTSAAIATIAFSALPTSGTISVMGVTITLTNVLSQATLATACNNLASSINAMTTAVAAGISNAVPQLRNLIFARGPAGGAPAGTVQIMTRVGAVSLNYANNVSNIIATTFNNVTSTATDHQFAGATSGCYGYFSNEISIWPQALTTFQYGLISGTVRPLAGYPLAGDKLKIRSNKNMAPVAGINTTVYIYNGGTTSNPTIWEFDDGTEWPADGFEPKFIMQANIGSAGNLIFGAGIGNLIVRGKRYTDGSNNFILASSGTPSLSNALSFPIAAPPIQWNYCTFDMCTYSPSGTGGILLGYGGGSQALANATSNFLGCRFAHRRNTPFIQLGNTNTYNTNFHDCTFANTGAVVKNDGIINVPSASGVISLTSCKFEDFIIGSQICLVGVGSATSSIVACNVVMKDTKWGNVSARGPYLATSVNASLVPYGQSFVAGSNIETEDFMLDTKLGFVEWNSTRSQPTLNAKLQDAITPMSYRFVSSTNANNISVFMPFESPRIAKKNTLPNGQRTITLEFCLEDNLVWDKSMFWFVFDYTDTNGKSQVIDTFDENKGAFTVSTSTWSQESGGKVTYVDGGSLLHKKFKISITTPTGKNLAINTEMGLTVRIAGVAGNITQGGFICPEFLVT